LLIGRLIVPNCGKKIQCTLRRLEGNPKCPACGLTFKGKPFVRAIEKQMADAVKKSRREFARTFK